MKKNLALAQIRPGFSKIRKACLQARRDGLEYLWVDTCCIDKRSSAELSEEINSMFSWYKNATVCYAYLSDVSGDPFDHEQFQNSAWFTRGWTLQELLAPKNLRFYDKTWWDMGHKIYLKEVVEIATGITASALEGRNLRDFPISVKMSWAARRITTRREDIVYCLLGIFDVNMPLLYGEGDKAFGRLQEHIIRYTGDHSIFNWHANDWTITGMLAPSITCFANSVPVTFDRDSEHWKFTFDSRGITAKWKIHPWMRNIYVTFVDCRRNTDGRRIPIFLSPTAYIKSTKWHRIHLHGTPHDADEDQCCCVIDIGLEDPKPYVFSFQEIEISVSQGYESENVGKVACQSTASQLLGASVRRFLSVQSRIEVMTMPNKPGNEWIPSEHLALDVMPPPGRYGLVCLVRLTLPGVETGYITMLGYDFNMHLFLVTVPLTLVPRMDEGLNQMDFAGHNLATVLARGIETAFGGPSEGGFDAIWSYPTMQESIDCPRPVWPNASGVWMAQGSVDESHLVLVMGGVPAQKEKGGSSLLSRVLQIHLKSYAYVNTGYTVTFRPLCENSTELIATSKRAAIAPDFRCAPNG